MPPLPALAALDPARPDYRMGEGRVGIAGALGSRPPGLVEHRAELALRRFQSLPPLFRQVRARAVDIESEHRHRRPVGIALASLAVLRRSLQRLRDLMWAVLAEDVGLEIERV